MRTQTKNGRSKVKPGFFRFQKKGRSYLLTNDLGRFCRLSPRDFSRFIDNAIDPSENLYNRLAEDFFLLERRDIPRAVAQHREKHFYCLRPPSLHIVVPTLRCNYCCVYCQANRRGSAHTQYDMTQDTARRVVDTILSCPSPYVTIEFQGGEPLLNWPVVRFIVEYARRMNARVKKELFITMVTNLSLLTDGQYDFFRRSGVSLCTSLDGPEDIHNANRPWPGHNSYQATAGWIKKMRAQQRRDEEMRVSYPRLGALVTITRKALPRLRAVIDEYRALGFADIHLRKLSYLGLSGGTARRVIGYTPEEFIEAWKDALDYVVELNKKGELFVERGALIFLQKILTQGDPDFLDIRSPCGAAAGQLAYNYNGDVYTCDEARMQENDTFLLGNVLRDDYQAILSSPKVKAMLVASTLENLACDECVYKPYCGICPVVNMVHYGTLFPSIRQTELCMLNSAMLDYVFEKLLDRGAAEVFQRWITRP